MFQEAKRFFANRPKPYDEELIPLEFKREVDTIAQIVFHPRNFEKGNFYDKYFAARILKKYLPSSGDLIYRKLWKKLGAPNQVSIQNSSLRFAEEQTRKFEMIHVIFFVILNSIMTAGIFTGELKFAFKAFVINLFVNVIPIIIQRRNRVYLWKAMLRLEKVINNRYITEETIRPDGTRFSFTRKKEAGER